MSALQTHGANKEKREIHLNSRLYSTASKADRANLRVGWEYECRNPPPNKKRRRGKEKKRKRSKGNSTYRDTYRGEEVLSLSLSSEARRFIYLSSRREFRMRNSRTTAELRWVPIHIYISLSLFLPLSFSPSPSFSPAPRFHLSPRRSLTGAFLPANPLSPPNENSLARTSFTNYVSSASNSSNCSSPSSLSPHQTLKEAWYIERTAAR